jgi:cytoskeletal protein CcmA (bactofilin family)
MSDLRIRSIDEASIETLLADDVDFEGELEISESLLIKGGFRGSISSDNDLFVAEGAHVDAELRARTVTVHGTLSGTIETTRRLELFSGSVVSGSISTPDLIVQSGCLFSGRCSMPNYEGGNVEK